MTRLEGVGLISDMERTLNQLQKMSRKIVSEEQLIGYAKEAEVLYYQGSTATYVTDEKLADVKMLLLKGFYGSKHADQLYLFFRRRKSARFDTTVPVEDRWSGTYVGTMDFFHNQIMRKVNFNTGPISYRSLISERVLLSLYSLLLDKEHWKTDGATEPLKRLKIYLKNTFLFSQRFIGENANGVRYNNTRTKVLFNSRLFSKYGYYIIMCADLSKDDSVSNMVLVDSDQNLTQLGFEDETRPEPISVSKHISQYIFDADESAFNLTNPVKLNHIINDRSFRFQDLKGLGSELDLSFAVKNSVKVATLLSRTNPNYVHPMYSVEYNEVQFLIPLHTQFMCLNRPQCALVVRKTADGVWVLQTVLDMPNAYLNARVIKRPDELWLTLGGV